MADGRTQLVTVQVPAWLWQRVKKEARESGESIRHIVRGALESETDRRRRKKERSAKQKTVQS